MCQYRIALIYPYFRNKNSLFDLWLKTCQYNKDITFIIYTDQTISVPIDVNNIRVRCMTFEQFKKIIQNSFDFKIQLQTPYKICDFRPAFGDIFSEELQEFTHWGYGDTDVILGEMNNFLTNELLEKYDKLFWCGHLCIYKNNERMNKLYKCKHGSRFPYIDVFSNPRNCIFDEWWGDKGIDELAVENSCAVYRDVCFADIERMYRKVSFNFDFKLAFAVDGFGGNIEYFEWNNGKLYGISSFNGVSCKREFLYAHFQKRNFVIKVTMDAPVFYIVPNFILGAKSEVLKYYGTQTYIQAKEYETQKYFEWYKRLDNSNVTRERIRQIEAKALRKLRHPSRSKLLKETSYEKSSLE